MSEIIINIELMDAYEKHAGGSNGELVDDPTYPGLGGASLMDDKERRHRARGVACLSNN